MLYVGLDLSGKRLDWHARRPDGELVDADAVVPAGDGLARLVYRFGTESVVAAIESMTGARFVHDELERAGWDVRIADAARAKALAPRCCRTDTIDAWVLCEIGRRDLVPEIWLPDPAVRAACERARFRLHLARHRTALKNRIHSTLIQHGHQRPVSDLFGRAGRDFLDRVDFPEPRRGTLLAGLRPIDELDQDIARAERELRALGADHRDIPHLMTCPGIGGLLGDTIAGEIGDIARFPSPPKLVSHTGLVPRVHQSGRTARRGPLTTHGPRYLRWALIEAAQTACHNPV
ncbi:MAG: IS110 family transposase [Actinomycetota bacterium]